MRVLMALVVGGLYASGTYLLLRRSMVRLVLGIVLLGHGTNLLLLVAGGLVKGLAPLVAEGEGAPPPASADPLAQALVLTAIVIGLGLQAFVLALVRRAAVALGTGDVDSLRATER